MTFWTDHCQHGPACYVDSFIYYERTATGEHKSKIDIYIFADSYYGHEICLRYGEQASDYLSPTGLAVFIRSAGHGSAGLYSKALEVLLRRGKIKWERNEN